MIRPVDVGVAVGTAPVEIFDGAEGLRLGRMTAAVVTAVAYARHAHFQELRIVAAVRFVAVGAVFEDGRMFPEEGAAALGVATDAVFVGRGLDELLGVRRTMWIVATGTSDLTFAIGHMRGALQLGTAHLMALQAQFRLLHFHTLVVREGLAIPRVRGDADVNALFHLMTVHAGDSAGFVWAALPEDMCAARMTIHTDGVLLGDTVG